MRTALKYMHLFACALAVVLIVCQWRNWAAVALILLVAATSDRE